MRRNTHDLRFDHEEIMDFLFENLITLGYSPSEEELEDIANITFEYIVDSLEEAGFDVEIFDEGEDD